MQNNLRIATRQSPLALWQAEHVKKELQKHWPHLEIELLPLKTSGDRFLQQTFTDEKGIKGLFVKELEDALLDGRADLAVHSMKDVPGELPKGLGILAILKRDNPFDAFLSPHFKSLDEMPHQARIGTSSLRRQSQLLRKRSDLSILPLRGNIQTRLKKLDNGEFDAIILAEAGLSRMQIERERVILTPDVMLPAPAQGALAIEGLLSHTRLIELVNPLKDVVSANVIKAEREVSRALGGGCHVPLAVLGTLKDGKKLLLKTRILSSDGKRCLEDEREGSLEEPILLAKAAIDSLIQKGVLDLLSS